MQLTPMDQTKEPKCSDLEIFRDIWISPWKILRFVHQQKYDKFLYLLLCIAGISRYFDRAVNKDMGDTMSLSAIIGMSILFGGFLGWISYYIYAALVSWTGQWLNAKGKTYDILRVFAYASIPSVLGLLLFIFQMLIYGKEIFKADGDIFSAGLIGNIIFYSLVFFEFVLVLYTFVFSIIGVAIVQNFSILKAILNMLLAVLVIGIPIAIIASIVGLI